MRNNSKKGYKQILSWVLLAIPILSYLLSSTPGKGQEPFRGWGYVVSKLSSDGISEETLRKMFDNSNMPIFNEVEFALNPQESQEAYARFTDTESIALAKAFELQERDSLRAMEKKYSISRHLVTAILLIETRFGEKMGKELVANRLARVSSVAEPENLAKNIKRHQSGDPSVTSDSVVSRAKYLEETFYPELLSLARLAQKNKLDPLALTGSISGAFGMCQFLPGTYEKYGIDGDGNGFVDLSNTKDAIFSVANFFTENGWNNNNSYEEKRKIIWKYNRSEPYIDTVLKVMTILKNEGELSR